MSNIVYTDDLYNEDIKNRFLENYPSGTRKTVLRIFKVSSKVEHDLSKDLFNFNREQIRKLLYLFMPKKSNSSRQNGTLITNYIDWAIDEELTGGINPLIGVTPDWYDQFVDTKIKQYFTDEELNYIISKCENKQDAVILSLLKEGAAGGGEANFEITSLRQKDVNYENNILTLHSEDGSIRKLIVSDQCIELCRKAMNETQYHKVNGDVSVDAKSPMTNLVDTDYILKLSRTNNSDRHEQADKHIIHRRLTVLSNQFDEILTARNIVYSGMISMGRDLLKRDGELGKKQYNEICERFNQSKTSTGDYNYARLKSEFLNEEKVRELYPNL